MEEIEETSGGFECANASCLSYDYLVPCNACFRFTRHMSRILNGILASRKSKAFSLKEGKKGYFHLTQLPVEAFVFKTIHSY